MVQQTPDGPLTQHLTVGPGHAVGVDLLNLLGFGKLQFGGPASRRFLTPPAPPAALFFCVDTIGGGRGRGIGWAGGRFPENLGFVLGQSLLEALDFGVEVLDETLLPFE